MAKLTLVANPTFKASVGIPVAGGGVVNTGFTFKHRTVTQREEWSKSLEGKPDAEVVLSILTGWEFDEPLNQENVFTLLDNHAGARDAIIEKYYDELTGVRTKNSKP
jgi:hypothetical protein